MINKASFHLGSKDSTISNRSIWILVHFGSCVYCDWDAKNHHGSISLPVRTKNIFHGLSARPLPPSQHITEDWKGNTKVQNDSMFQGPTSVRDNDSYRNSRFILGAIWPNKMTLLVWFFYFSHKKKNCHHSKFHHASWPCLLQQTIQHMSLAIPPHKLLH